MTTTTAAPTTALVPWEPITVTFHPEPITAGVTGLDDDGREDLDFLVAQLHQNSDYLTVCEVFRDYLDGTTVLTTTTPAELFTVSGLPERASAQVWLQPSASISDARVEGVELVAMLTTPDPDTGGPAGGITVTRYYDDPDELYGTDPDPLATLHTLGRTVADAITTELAAADTLHATRTRAAVNRAGRTRTETRSVIAATLRRQIAAAPMTLAVDDDAVHALAELVLRIAHGDA